MSQEERTIASILSKSHTIAVVGLSARAERASHEVAAYMQSQGYRIVPVNPAYAGTYILGERCYATLAEAAEALIQDGGKIDIVNCFRKSAEVGPAIEEAILIGASSVWLQLGVFDEAAMAKARQAGLQTVVDKCIKIEHRRLH
ncbi:MAG TPA: CoA-binding protein [Noviherbaspirillum sp.]|nr:CoA-binding protein [Noviherbaspirillum sp.]